MKFLVLLAALWAAPLAVGQVVCSGTGDNTIGLQAMIDAAPAGTEVVLPDGPCMVSGLVIPKSLTVTGRGRTTIRRVPGTWEDLVSIPAKWGEHQGKTVTNVTLRGVTVDGNYTPVNPPGTANYSGIRILAGANITVENVTVMNQMNEGLSAGVGYEPIRNLIIRNSRFYRIQRNAIHLGFVDVAKVVNCWIEETPDQLNFVNPSNGQTIWAGNAIDIEVEGINSYVKNVLIDGVYMNRQHKVGLGTAGTGVAVQPAYGPIDGVKITNCTFRNHQLPIQVNDPLGTDVVNVVVSDNTFSYDQQFTTGYGGGQFVGATNIQYLRNELKFDAGPAAMAAVVHLLNVKGFRAAFNNLFPYHWPFPNHPAETPTFLIQNSSGVWLDKNKYNGGVFTIETNSTVTKTGNVQVP